MSVLSAKFSEIERNVPLSAISGILHARSDWLYAQIEDVRERWKDRLLARLGGRGNLLVRRFSQYANLFPSFPPAPRLEKEDEEKVFCHTAAEFLCLLEASGSGQLVILDDLQWADETSLAIVRALVNLASDVGLNRTLFLGTYRSDEVGPNHPLTGVTCLNPLVRNIRLGPLARAESHRLVGLLLDEESPEIRRLQDMTYDLTSGNPFFIYEYLKAVLAAGVFAPQPGGEGWRFDVDLAASQGLTKGVAGLVAKRILRLPAAPLEVIVIASAVGTIVTN